MKLFFGVERQYLSQLWYLGQNNWLFLPICFALQLPTRAVTCGAIESSCSRSVSSSSNHIWKDCAGPGLGYWRCGISYGWNLTNCGSRYRNLAPLFASARDAGWHPARAATGCEQNGGNLNQLRPLVTVLPTNFAGFRRSGKAAGFDTDAVRYGYWYRAPSGLAGYISTCAEGGQVAGDIQPDRGHQGQIYAGVPQGGKLSIIMSCNCELMCYS